MDQTCDQKQNLPAGWAVETLFFSPLFWIMPSLTPPTRQSSQINLNPSEAFDWMETVENNGNNPHLCQIYWVFLIHINVNYTCHILRCSLTYWDLQWKPTQSSNTLTHTDKILLCLHTIFHIFLSPLMQDEITFKFGQIGEKRDR